MGDDPPADARADGSVNAEEHETRVIEMGIREHRDRSRLAVLLTLAMVLAIYHDSCSTTVVRSSCILLLCGSTSSIRVPARPWYYYVRKCKERKEHFYININVIKPFTVSDITMAVV